jgi:hypothetical protein
LPTVITPGVKNTGAINIAPPSSPITEGKGGTSELSQLASALAAFTVADRPVVAAVGVAVPFAHGLTPPGVVPGTDRGMIVVAPPGAAETPGEALAVESRLAVAADGTEEGRGAADVGPSGGEQATPVGRAAELVASFSPFEPGSLERAIDQFLGRLGGLDSGLTRLGDPVSLIPGAVAAAVAITVAETVRRRLREPWEDEASGGDGDAGVAFPGLPGRPGRWALEEL